MSILTSLLKNDKQNLVGKISDFFDTYVPAMLRRSCGLAKPADLVMDSSAGGEQLSFTDSMVVNSNIVTGTFCPSERIRDWLGVPADTILFDKMALPLLGNQSFFSLWQMNREAGITNAYQKDTWYRFDQMHVNWEGLQIGVASNVIPHITANTDMHGYRGALAIDDSLFARSLGVHGGKSRNRVTEFLGSVYDHTDKVMRIGFRMMTAVWTNGEDTVPVTQALLATRDENLRIGSFDMGDGRTWEGKRRKVAVTRGTEVMVQMVETAIKAGIEFDDVLADTWFSKPAQAIAIKKLGVNLIAMMSKGNAKFGVLPEGKAPGKTVKVDDLEWMDVKKIYRRGKKRRGVSRYLLSVEAWMKDKDGTLYPVRLVFARNHSNRKEWVVFICTDTSLSEKEILARYGYRWNVERFFKIEKSYLGLQDCHSTSYDALTARMVIAALRFMFLTVQRFDSSDNRSIEQIFAQTKREVAGLLVENAMIYVTNIVFESVERVLHPTKEQIRDLILDFLDHLPEAVGGRFDREKANQIA